MKIIALIISSFLATSALASNPESYFCQSAIDESVFSFHLDTEKNISEMTLTSALQTPWGKIPAGVIDGDYEFNIPDHQEIYSFDVTDLLSGTSRASITIYQSFGAPTPEYLYFSANGDEEPYKSLQKGSLDCTKVLENN